MATFEETSDAVLAKHNDLSTIAEAAYTSAREDLDAMALGVGNLPLTIVDTTIGDDADINWTATVVAPTAPVEPDYSGDVPAAPTVATVSKPGTVVVSDLPAWDADISGQPGTLADASLGTVAVLDTLPTIDAATPTIDVALLDSDFLFTEPTYVERVSPQVQLEIQRVLGGDLGLPQAHWDALWQEAAGDLARVQVGNARRARNRGAASYWSLPSEAVLTASREVADEAQRSLQLTRLQKAVQQAVFAREDFWQAIAQGIAYENQWIAAAQQAAQRALAAAEQTHTARVVVHNANIARFNSLLEATKIDGSIEDLAVQRVLKQHAAELATNATEIEQGRQRVMEFQARWEGYKTDTSTSITHVAEKTRWWASQVDADAKYEELKQRKSGLDVQSYTAQLGAIDSVARAAASILQARTGVALLDLKGQELAIDLNSRKNTVELDRSRITQAAQEAKARIDVAQAQWVNGQGITMATRVADLSFGYAQATMAAAHVGLSSSAGISLSGDA